MVSKLYHNPPTQCEPGVGHSRRFRDAALFPLIPPKAAEIRTSQHFAFVPEATKMPAAKSSGRLPWSQDHSLTRVRSKVGLVERNIGGLDNRRPRIELTLDEGLGFGRRTADRFKRGTSDQLLGLVAL